MRITFSSDKRCIICFCQIILCIFSYLLFLDTGAWAGSELDQLREAEVLKARSGELESSIETLEQYLLDHPDNIPLISDLIVLHGWSGNHAKATDLYRQRLPATFSDYVHTAIIDSYRSLGKSDQALEIADFLLQRNGDDPAFVLKKIQLLVDTGKFEEAEKLLDSLSDSVALGADFARVAGYLYSRKGDWLAALRQYQDILAVVPDDSEALIGKVNALLNLGAAHAAAKHADPHQDLFDVATQADLLRTKAALFLRWSTYASKSSEESLMLASRALVLHLVALGTLPLEMKYDSQRRLVEYDMVVAFAYLRRYEDSYSLYLSLLERGDVPAYVSQAAAQSLLALRRPGESIEIIKVVLEEEPENYQAKIVLFYAYIENEEFSNAYDLIDKAIETTPAFKTFVDSPEQYQNDERLELEIIASQARLFADQLDDAWDRISAIKNMAPANAWLAQVAGETALARDWPRQADAYFQEAYRLNPDIYNALEGRAQSQIRLHNYSEASETLHWLKENHPAEAATERLERDLYWAQRPDLWADLELSYSQGPEQSGNGITATGELISSPINEYLHLIFQSRYAWTELPEGEESLTRYGGGVELISDPFSILALANYNDSTLDESGGVLRGIWTPDDHWRVSLQADRFSEETPLRALHYGIRMDRIAGAVNYRLHEGSELAARLSSGNFTDNNDRVEGGLAYTSRLVDMPRFDVDGIFDIFGSTNSRDDAPYYNPEADLKIKGEVTAEHILYRYYEKSLVQQLGAGLGIYAQKNYDTGAIGSLRYELRYQYHPMIETRLAGEIGQNRYDGADEPYYKLNVMIHAKF